MEILLALWFSTWTMLIYRTFWIIRELLHMRNEKIITKYPILHFTVYIIGMAFMAPFVWHIAFFEEPRKRWCLAYADAVMGKGK